MIKNWGLPSLILGISKICQVTWDLQILLSAFLAEIWGEGLAFIYSITHNCMCLYMVVIINNNDARLMNG